jgi:hypothetical protein
MILVERIINIFEVGLFQFLEFVDWKLYLTRKSAIGSELKSSGAVLLITEGVNIFKFLTNVSMKQISNSKSNYNFVFCNCRFRTEQNIS